jgi:hypothetical protein
VFAKRARNRSLHMANEMRPSGDRGDDHQRCRSAAVTRRNQGHAIHRLAVLVPWEHLSEHGGVGLRENAGDR